MSENVFRASGGVGGIGRSKGFVNPELFEYADNLFWLGQNRDRGSLEACARLLTGFEFAIVESWE